MHRVTRPQCGSIRICRGLPGRQGHAGRLPRPRGRAARCRALHRERRRQEGQEGQDAQDQREAGRGGVWLGEK